MFLFPLKNLARKELRSGGSIRRLHGSSIAVMDVCNIMEVDHGLSVFPHLSASHKKILVTRMLYLIVKKGYVFLTLFSALLALCSGTSGFTAEWAINSSPFSATYMRQWTVWALVQIMACILFSTKPLSKPMLCYCQMDSYEQTSIKF